MGELTLANDNFPEKLQAEIRVELAQKARKIIERAHNEWPSLASSKIHQETYDECVRANKTPLDVVSIVEMLMMTPERVAKDRILLSRVAAYIKYVEEAVANEDK